MFDLIKSGPRSLENFGIAGILNEKAEIVYETLFDTQSLGRVSDLLAAHLKSSGADEVRLRVLLILGILQIHQNKIVSQDSPILMETGVDGKKLAIGFSFSLSQTIGLQTKGFVNRLVAGEPRGELERLLVEVHGYADQLYVRFQPLTLKFEIVLSLEFQTLRTRLLKNKNGKRNPPILVILDDAQIESAPQPKSYKQLGDLDYSSLLEEKRRASQKAARLETEVTLPSTQKEGESEINVSGGKVESEIETVVSGGKDELEEETRVSGGKAEKEAETRVSGGKAEKEAETRLSSQQEAQAESKISGQESALEENVLVSGARDEHNEQAKAFRSSKMEEQEFVRIKGQSESIIDQEMTLVTGQSVEPKASRWGLSRLKAFFVGDPKPKAGVKIPSETSAPYEDSKDPVALGESVNDKDLELPVIDLEPEIKQIQEEANALKDGLENTKVKKWIKKIVNNLLTERGRVHEVTKKLNAMVLSREIEIRTRLSAFQEEIKRKDSEIAQKEKVNFKNREQLTQVLKELEKYKVEATMETSSAHLKQKYNLSQKTMLLLKEENSTLSRRVEELKNQLLASQVASKSDGVSAVEHNALREKFVQVFRQAEEFKRANRQLMDHLNEAKRGATAGVRSGSEGVQNRLEAAMKMTTAAKKEAEEIKNRLLVSQKQEANLKVVVNRLQGEINRLNNKRKSELSRKPNDEGETPAA